MNGQGPIRRGVSGSGKGGLNSFCGGLPNKQMNRTRPQQSFYLEDPCAPVMVSHYPAGSYVLIPRGTPHAQGNRGKVPARILLTMTPGGLSDLSKIGLNFSRRQNLVIRILGRNEKRMR